MKEVVWQSKLDGLYDVKVERISEYQGEISISRGEFEMKRTQVPLAYGAIFGPDVSDVAVWQDWAVNVVDNMKVDE